ITAAEDLLAEDNIDSFEIPNLCRRLGVTKGSFYWHFNGRRELLVAILNDWRKRMTMDVAVRASRLAATVPEVLRYVLGLIRKPRANRNSAIEKSMREWAKKDSFAHSAVAEVDQIRLAYFEQLFRKYGFSEEEANLRAYAAYAAMMGDSILKE